MNLKGQLQNQIYFIEASCRAYDQGQHVEAIRVAVALRVLFHDTKNQTSLLTQMGAKEVAILSTVPRAHPNAVLFSGMGRVKLSGTGARIEPALGDAPTKQIVSRDDWWHQTVAVAGYVKASRRDIVLGAANKDGGAHVDPKMGHNYMMLRQGIWTSRVYAENGKIVSSDRIERMQLPCLRQMGYEVLNSPDLAKLCT